MRISLLSTACRLPGADTPHGFWKTLVDGKTLRSPVPADRFDIGAFSSDFWPTEIRPPSWGTFIKDPWKFDASRFHFHEEEADWTDPQQRLLLTCTHEAFDAAGIEPGECRTGVFIGGSYVSYNDRMRQQIMAGRKVPDTTIVGGLANMLSARISQVFAFNGPSLTVDTACSSVLVALHLARRSIEAGECNIAVVGGAHLIVSATAHLLMGRAGALSPEGHCLPFGAAADGTLLGEGVGVFLVASTDLAASRKWPELARIVATAVDSDGPTLKPMAPRPGGQVEVMRRAWEEAGLDPETASLIEAHGAGTPVGDRVEASSLAEFFSASPRNRHLGSVKGNVGHLMSAAGVPSLLKVVLAMQHRVVPATLFGSAPSPKLKLQNSGLSIHDRSVAWDGERVLRAGINGFGFGGTNAHVVVESVPGAEHHFLFKPLSSGRPHRIAPEMIPGALEGMQAVPFEAEADGAPDLPETKWFETVVWRSVDDRVPSGLPKVIWTIDGEPGAIGEAEPTCVRGRVAVLPETDDPLEAVRHVHCIARAAQRAPFRLITRGAFSFADDPPPRPAAAAAAAYVAALKAEWGDWQVDVVDLEPGVPVEVALRSPVRGISSFRDGRFYRRILHSAEAPPLIEPTCGVWVLFGGATGITYEIAKALAGPGQTLFLVGRTPLSEDLPRSDRIAALRASGAAVEYLQGDVRAPAAILDAALARGHLAGIVHGAGAVRPRSLDEITDEDLAETLGGKLLGALALRDAFQVREIDPRVIVLSSISASMPELLGGYLASYAAANAGLDALAQAMRMSGHPWSALAYSVWGETGMGAEAGIVDAMARLGLRGLDSASAARAALRLAGSGQAFALVVDRAALRPGIGVSALPDPKGDLPAFVRAVIARVVTVDPEAVTRDATFTDLDIDSIGAVEMAVMLQEAGFYGIPDSVIFEVRTVGQLEDLLRDRLAAPDSAAPAPAMRETEAAPVRARPAVSEVGRVAHGFAMQSCLDPAISPFSYLRLTLPRPIDPTRLSTALKRIVSQHSALHRRFVWRGGTLVAEHAEMSQPAIFLYDVANERALSRLDDSLATTPFVIGVAPLWRVAIITDGDMCHLAIAAHHAILDGWSLHRILEKTWRLYETPRSVLLPEPDVPAIDRKDPELVAAYAVETAEPWPTLPGLTGNVLSGPRAAVHRRLTEQDSRRVREAATSRGETYFMHVAASVARGIASWAGLDALVLQVAIARRGGEIHPDVIGSFSDTVPVRLGAHAGIADMRDAWDKAAKAGFPGLFDLHDLLGSAPDGGPKVASPFSLSVADFRTELRDGPKFSDIVARTATHATRLGFTVWRSGSGIGIALNYPPSWIAQAEAEALTDVVLEEILGSSDFAHFTDAILAQCARVPERIAIRHAGDSVSYGELEQVSARVAAGLDARGIGAGDIVGILAEPGIRATAAILGIARSGAAWLPLGQSQGIVRVKAMIEDAEPTLVINVGTKLDGLESIPLEKVMIDAPAPVVRHEPQDLAYVVFTSGSQGRPKGVPIRKESVSHYLHWSVGMMQLTEADRLLQTAPLIFDASIRQLFAPLMVGAAMHPAKQEDLSDPVALWCRMCGEQISVLNTSPMMATRIANAALGCGPPADGLRLVTIGGEALPESLVRKWFSIGGENLRIVNLYGPSETTINATWHEVARGDDPVPIGRPLPGYEGFVLDDTGKEVPEGELCIGGIGRFDGYLGNADVRFSRAPDGSTVYRTGDRVRRRPDGELIYLGRHDDQVQIQGVRIELAEVETALTACKAVDLALVRAVGEAPDRFLQAWVQTAREQWDETEVRRELLRRLPAVMIPRQICRCDRLPVTPSGKLDRRADLPVAPADGHLRGGPPRTPAEIKVAECWTRALGCGEIGIEDDFFALGGDSLSAISVSIELGADGAASLFANSRLRDYAAALEEILLTAAETALSGPTRPTLLPAQIGFLRIGQNDPGSAVWSSVIALPGDIDEALLGEAWALLHERHPMLRAAFPGRRITYLDARPPAISTAAEAWPPALDPESGWLARARCVRGRDGASLEFIAHHLIGDAWSIAVMVRDFEALYDRLRAGEAPDLAPPEVLPEDIACRLAAQTVREKDTAYWRERMSAPYAAPFDDAPVGDIIRTHRMVPEAGARQVVGAVYAALRESTGQADQIIAVARSGRDLPLPGIADVVAPLATALPVRINAGPNQDPVLAAAEAMQGALAHALNPSQILQAARLTRIPEIPVFVSDLRFPAKRSAAPARFEFDPSRTAFQLPTGTGMLVTVSRAAKGLRIAFTTRSGVFDAQAFEAFADMTVAALSARHSRSVALITYLPTRARLRSLLGMDPATLLGTEPRWLGEARTSSGTCRVLLLPKFADELDVGIDELARAVSLARSAGAQYVGLAGLLPSLTDYGHALASRLAPQDAAALTTGHAATAVAMAGTVLSALEQVKARWRDASVALVGVGSIGRATLGLLCEQSGPPAAISLCDLASRRRATEQFAASLSAHCRLLVATSRMPSELYEHDLIIGASSQGGIVSIHDLRAGTILVDDSFPHCFDPSLAHERMDGRKDVVVVGGGLLDFPSLEFVPDPGLAHWQADLDTMMPRSGLPGCAVGALIDEPSLGLVNTLAVKKAWQATIEGGLTVPPLHLDTREVSPDVLKYVSKLRGGS